MLKAFLDGELIASSNEVTSSLLVVGLHGWARNSRDFDSLSEILQAKGVAFLAPDLPGFGESPKPAFAWNSQDYANQLDVVLTELTKTKGVSRVVVVGHSFGGKIAIKLGAFNPGYLQGVVIMGTPLFRDLDSVRKVPLKLRLAKQIARYNFISAAQLDRIKSNFGSQDYRNATGVMRDVLVRTVNEDFAQDLEALKLKVRFIWGELDRAASVADAKRALGLIGDSSLEIIPGGDHFSPLADQRLIANLALEIANYNVESKTDNYHCQEKLVE